MISLRKINAIFKKQIRDTFKNRAILLQFLMFPLLTVVMANTVQVKDMEENFFVTLFATMYVGMAPLISMASIIAEEKEMNTLRVLLMSNVKAIEYLIGVGLYVVILCLAGSCILGSQGHYSSAEFGRFLIIMLMGILTASVFGAVIGVSSKNQMSATSITVPLMMVFAFLPMIASFNKDVHKFSRVFYSQQINDLINDISSSSISSESIVVVGANILVACIAFAFAYRKFGLQA